MNNLIIYLNSERFFKHLVIFFILGYLVSTFLNLGVPPFNNEEPRRTLIALEMLFSGNYVVTTLFGDVFYDHPPLWNIVLAQSAKLFGISSEFGYRLPSALSFIITGIVIFFMGRKYVNKEFALISTFFYLVSADLYFFFSTTAEIDIFFSLFVLLATFSVFHFNEKNNLFLLYAFAYFFTTLAFFSKGVVSIVFLGGTLLAYFGYKREWKKLFSLYHLLFFVLFLGAVFGYFYIYHQREDAFAYIEGMWSLTEKKSILNSKNNAFLSHFFAFPLKLLGNLFPATLLLVFLFGKKTSSYLKENPYVFFLLLAIVLNVIPYWISTGSRDRYAYFFYPLIISIFVYIFLYKKSSAPWKRKLFFYLLSALTLIVAFACFVLPFVSYLNPVKGISYFAPLIGVLCVLVFVAQIKTNVYKTRIILSLFTVVIAKLLFVSLAFPMKNSASTSSIFKAHAKTILEKTNKTPLYLYSKKGAFDPHKPGEFYVTGAYLEMYSGQTLKKTDSLFKNAYFIVEGRALIVNSE